MNSHFEELTGKMRTKDQCLAELQLQAQQPRLAAKEDEEQDIKTHERTEGAAVDDKKCGDISSARVYDNPTSLASFGNLPKPPVLPEFIDNDLVDEGAEAPKPCLSPMEMRTLKPTGDLLLARSASVTLRAVVPSPPFSWSFCEKTEKRNSGSITHS